MPTDAFTLTQLVSGRLLRVPPFQRGYAWEDRQLTDLLEDLDLVAEGGAVTHRDHYTGTVVLLEREGAEPRLDKMGVPLAPAEVVDGQQRLTTLILLLHLLAKAIGEHDAELTEGIEQSFVLVRLRGGESVPKLRLHGDLNVLWEEHILRGAPRLGGPMTAAQARLVTASERLAAYLARRDDETPAGHQDRLVGLYETVSLHLRFNLYTVEDDADAAVVFETVNARGKPLTELEKVKNYLMYAAGWIGGGVGNDLQERINTVWSEIYRLLMGFGLGHSSFEDQLLRSHWYLVERPVVRDFRGAVTVKERFRIYDYRDRTEELADEIRRYLETLLPSALAYAEALQPEDTRAFGDLDHTARRRVVHHAARLSRAGNTGPFLPLVIGARQRFRDDPEGFAQLLDLSERLAFRLYRVLGARSDTGQSDLNWLAHEMWTGEVSSVPDVADRLRVIVHQRARDERVFATLGTEGNWYHWGGLVYFLYEYEAHLTGTRRMAREWGEVRERQKVDSIEHILPQAADGEWLQSFADERERADLTHTLGNLVLTWDNSSYATKSYTRKRGEPDWPAERRCYFNGHFVQERELAARYENWSPASVRARQQELVEFARKRWHVDLPAAPAEAELADDDEGDGSAP